jgi:hypothetical protein
LGKLYQSTGKKEQATAEFAKVNQLHRAEDGSLVHQMNGSSPPHH